MNVLIKLITQIKQIIELHGKEKKTIIIQN
jgi:hypothetical protein